MYRIASVPLIAMAAVLAAHADVVFKSEVSLVRVDAQVVERDNRAITGLRAEDFVLREEGSPQQIRHFSTEDTPMDVLLLLDVSGSMQVHVERIANAARSALQILGRDDQVAIMVFDRGTRLRLPFRSSRTAVQRELDNLLRDESFNGGTDITRALYASIAYVQREARREARRAIVILTDDQTERNRDEAGVGRALLRAETVLSALLAPNAVFSRSSGGGWPGGNWPPVGGGPLGGIIFGRRGPLGGGGGGMPQLRSAGTAEIARSSGGDSMSVDDALALESTLLRIRQRYALHFHLPEGVKPGEERNIEVALSDAARRRYPNAEVRVRRVYLAPGATGEAPAYSEPVVISGAPVPSETPRRRPAVNEDGTRSDGWRREGEPSPPPVQTSGEPAQKGGWRRVKPGEQP